MTLIRFISLFWAVTAIACGASLDEAPPAEPQSNTTTDDSTYVNFKLEGADVNTALKALADATKKSLVIEPDAAALVRCASPINVRQEEKVTHQAAVKLVADAVQPSGLLVVEDSTSIILKMAPGARPCPS